MKALKPICSQCVRRADVGLVCDRTGRYATNDPHANLWCEICRDKSSVNGAPPAFSPLPDMFPATQIAPRMITLKQPWGWLIVNGLKDMENRNWKCSYTGPVLLMASAKLDMTEYNSALITCNDMGIALPSPNDIPVGGVIGWAEFGQQVQHNLSVWFVGRYAWPVLNHFKLPFTPAKGSQGLRHVPETLMIKSR